MATAAKLPSATDIIGIMISAPAISTAWILRLCCAFFLALLVLDQDINSTGKE
jgi:hypothetical protein